MTLFTLILRFFASGLFDKLREESDFLFSKTLTRSATAYDSLGTSFAVGLAGVLLSSSSSSSSSWEDIDAERSGVLTFSTETGIVFFSLETSELNLTRLSGSFFSLMVSRTSVLAKARPPALARDITGVGSLCSS